MTALDFTTNYLGLELKNPLVASASPLSKKVESVRRLEDAGVAAVVMYSLFEEQITHESQELDHYLERGTHSYAESLSYFPDLDTYNLGPEPYLEHLHRIKSAVSMPVIGSLNGVSSGGWVEYAQKIEQAGADALELDIYYLPTDIDLSGADLEELKVVPDLHLSTSHELRLPLRWIAILYGRIAADFAHTSGVHTARDVLKAMMAGASVAMMTSELLAHGFGRPRQILAEIQRWMEENEYTSIAQMKGCMSQRAVAEPAAFERANYMKALNSFDYYLP